MLFTIHGPFEIPRNEDGIISRSNDSKKIFWKIVDQAEDNLSGACGCYLFAVKHGPTAKPWYVGMASRRSFMRECLGSHQLNIYNEIIASQKGYPFLFLIAKRTERHKFAKPSKTKQRAINWLESFLISIGVEKNKNLCNISKTKLLRNLVVPGILNTPKGPNTISEKKFKQTLF